MVACMQSHAWDEEAMWRAAMHGREHAAWGGQDQHGKTEHAKDAEGSV